MLLRNKEDQITTVQTIYLVSSTIIAVGILTLPRVLAEEVGTPDMWISIILGGIFSLLTGFLVISLALRFPRKTFFDFSRQLAGRGAGSILSIMFVSYAILLGSFEIRSMGEVTQFYLLESTPIEPLMISMLWVGTYVVTGGINPIARLFELLAPITFMIFFLVIIMGVKMFHTENLLPVLGQGFIPVLKGVTPTFLTNSGIEFMMIWTAFMKEPQKAKRVIFWGIGLPISLYLTAIVIIIGALSLNGTKVETWPLITLIQQYEYRGILFERFESFLLIVWLIQIFATYVICHYIASLGLSQLFGKKLTPFVLIVLPFLYLTALFPQSINDVFAMGDMIGYYSLVVSVAFPVLLLGAARLKGERKGERRATN
ncbi:endospore germination permease [Bacillus haynesii]|uniref:GerAB/ArcD/ProY family transporter n=1 Tax=Bacillus haynesii TaxID=1925021 RepID=UPI0020CBC9D3|nr:endospore germination permease [Bacillus haynesii]MCY8222496.1 spore germination protein [Bacillus haynesii]MEC1417821.1 endospore germination permease [Bacillus haynesii]MEC1447763.1 endospore germination permease [Bacillus haynesii]MEC1469395.1 endospore germination permease [Bacillus haynesii]MEC1477761.1 endospore germination permease [Bacillus haynesii]